MGFWLSTIIIGVALAIACHFWERLLERKLDGDWRSLWIWAGKGLAAPVLVWALFNCGSAPWLIRVMQAKVAGKPPWFPVLLWEMTPGVSAIASFWLALTLGWWLWNFISAQRDKWDDYKPIIIFWSWILAPCALLILLLEGWWGVGWALAICFATLLYNLLGIEPVARAVPSYSRAIAKIKFGKYADAEMEIIGELERCADDFDGWMMLAELYASRFGDFAEAEATIRDVCDQPGTGASQVSVALHKLADWQLKFNQDPAAAFRALKEICEKFPGSHLAKMAQLRINQLPATKEALLEQQQHAKTIHLAPLNNALDDEAIRDETKLSEAEATRLANECVAKLKREPNDVPTREKLARLLAQDLGDADSGIEQMELLLKMPEQPEFKKAEWLACVAAWHLNLRNDFDSAKIFLNRLVAEHPNSAQGFSAARKLNLLKR